MLHYLTKFKIYGFIKLIGEALEHSSEATTKTYSDKFEQTEIDNTSQYLL